jgi:gamma-glutamylcyclotransferase (GGCT)/AIG2-like uncharacterized protein YtfP
MSPSGNPRLFVYGTLRAGGSNDIARLVPAATPFGTGRMRGTLFDLGTYPAMLFDPVAGFVRGEIYLIPDDGWAHLDALEHVVDANNPDGEYFRITAPVSLDGGACVPCQVYVANPARLSLDRLIAGGDWMRHTAGLPPAPTPRGRLPG